VKRSWRILAGVAIAGLPEELRSAGEHKGIRLP
jgi:hypothetical protein